MKENITHIEAMTLYERGAISLATLQSHIGIDHKAEAEAIKKEGDRLPLFEHSVREDKKTKILLQCQRIEQARRNVEVLSKVVCCSTANGSLKDEATKAIMDNIPILSSVKDMSV